MGDIVLCIWYWVHARPCRHIVGPDTIHGPWLAWSLVRIAFQPHCIRAEYVHILYHLVWEAFQPPLYSICPKKLNALPRQGEQKPILMEQTSSKIRWLPPPPPTPTPEVGCLVAPPINDRCRPRFLSKKNCAFISLCVPGSLTFDDKVLWVEKTLLEFERWVVDNC